MKGGDYCMFKVTSLSGRQLKDQQDKMARDLYGMTSAEAWEKRICIQCKEPISEKNIYSQAGVQEYAISGLCELCFDKITGGA